MTAPLPASSPPPASQARRAEGMLLVATFFWGWTFPVVKDAIAVMPVFMFLACRFGLAALIMLCFTRRPSLQLLKTGGVLGLLLFLSFAFQTVGLEYTSASNCAFITALNVIWVALFTARERRLWLAVAISIVGLWLMIRPDGAGGGINIGDMLTALSSIFIAWHIILLKNLDKNAPSNSTAMLQFAVVALLSLAVSLAAEENRLPPAFDGGLIFALLITVFGATLFSFWAQTHYQRHTTAARAAIIFIMEPVFAAIFSVLFYGEVLGAAAVLGAGLVLLAMLLAIMPAKKRLPAAAGVAAAAAPADKDDVAAPAAGKDTAARSADN